MYKRQGISHVRTPESRLWVGKQLVAGTLNHPITLFNLQDVYKRQALGKEIGTGEFGADMKVELMNDGPVTICIETKNKE